MHEELIVALQKATGRLPAALGAAVCALFMLAGVKVLVGADTWPDALATFAFITGFACAFNCCIAALKAKGGGDG